MKIALSDNEVRNFNVAVMGIKDHPYFVGILRKNQDLEFKARYSFDRIISKFKNTVEDTERTLAAFREEFLNPLEIKIMAKRKELSTEGLSEEKIESIKEELTKLDSELNDKVLEIEKIFKESIQEYDVNLISYSTIEQLKMNNDEYTFIKPLVKLEEEVVEEVVDVVENNQ